MEPISGSDVIPGRARPGLAGLRPHGVWTLRQEELLSLGPAHDGARLTLSLSLSLSLVIFFVIFLSLPPPLSSSASERSGEDLKVNLKVQARIWP